MADFYVRLSYEEYKRFEADLDNPNREKQHNTEDKQYYHKSIRLRLGDSWLEIHGPVVKAGLQE